MKFRSKWENHVRKVFQDLLIYIRWLSWQENTMVSIITKESAMKDLMDMVSEHKAGKLQMSKLESDLLIETLKEKAWQELDFGQELVQGPIKLVKRVTGNVSIFFGKI